MKSCQVPETSGSDISAYCRWPKFFKIQEHVVIIIMIAGGQRATHEMIKKNGRDTGHLFASVLVRGVATKDIFDVMLLDKVD